MIRGLSIVAALSGCDTVFGLEPVALRDDARSIDAPTVPPPCAADGSHDEDLDGLPDRCDLCPTVSSRNHDTDSDGVGDECDPSPGRDTIVRFYPLDTEDDLMLSGSVTQSGDSLKVDAGSFTTMLLFETPEQVTIAFDGLAMASSSASVVLVVGASLADNLTCQLSRLCTNGADVCLDGFQGSIHVTSATLPLPPAEVLTLTAYRDGGTVRCGINDVEQIHTDPLATMPDGAIQVSVPDGPISIASLIVYNSVP